MSTRTRRIPLLDVISLSVLGVGLLLAGFRFIPAVRLPLLYAFGGSAVCPYDLAVRAHTMISDHVSRMDEILEQMEHIDQDSNGLVRYATPRGEFWMPEGQKRTLASVLAEQDHHIYGAGRTGVQEGDIVIDCGGHVGAFTRSALDAGASLVVSVEPSPINRLALELNLKDEIETGRVIVYPKGVWHEEGVLPFYVDPGNSAGSSVLASGRDAHSHRHGSDGIDHGGDEQVAAPGVSTAASDPESNVVREGLINVALTTIDELMVDLNLDRVDFIKMDIEGAKQNALKGATHTLAKYSPRLAVASYHLESDQLNIPTIVTAANDAYQMECGPCGEMDMKIIPHTLLFQ